MLSKKTTSQLNGVFISAVYRDGYVLPPKILPVTFPVKEVGADLLSVLQSWPLLDSTPAPRADIRKKLRDEIQQQVGDVQIDLCFLRRNYDGSETYYIVTDMTYAQLDRFLTLVSQQKGGIL